MNRVGSLLEYSRKPRPNTRADLGPVAPLLLGNCFSFATVCWMVLRALLLKCIFFNEHYYEKIYQTLSLPGACALAAVTSATASIIKC